MAGAVEEGAKLAGGFMDALKREPLSLALVVMNLAMLLFFYFLLTTVASQREREIQLLYTDKKEVRELLAKCVVPGMLQPRPQGFTLGNNETSSKPEWPPSPIQESPMFKLQSEEGK